MASRALVILLALLLLILPFLTNNRSAPPPAITPTAADPTSEATDVIAPTAEATLSATPDATAEATVEPTPSATPEPTLSPTEATPDATAEATGEPTPETTALPTGEVSRFPSQLLTGDAVHGQFIFENGLNGAPACINCHSVTSIGKVGFALGPGLRGIADEGANRMADFTASLYIEDSIRFPNDFITSGFRGIMYANFAQDYSDQEIADLVAYLMTLHLVPDSSVPAA